MRIFKMQINSKTQYAVKILKYLLEEDVAKGKDIIKHLKISAPYLEQIMVVLIKNKLVVSIRGCNGGYKLAENAGDKTMWDVIHAFNSESWQADNCALGRLKKDFEDVARGVNLMTI